MTRDLLREATRDDPPVRRPSTDLVTAAALAAVGALAATEIFLVEPDLTRLSEAPQLPVRDIKQRIASLGDEMEQRGWPWTSVPSRWPRRLANGHGGRPTSQRRPTYSVWPWRSSRSCRRARSRSPSPRTFPGRRAGWPAATTSFSPPEARTHQTTPQSPPPDQQMSWRRDPQHDRYSTVGRTWSVDLDGRRVVISVREDHLDMTVTLRPEEWAGQVIDERLAWARWAVPRPVRFRGRQPRHDIDLRFRRIDEGRAHLMTRTWSPYPDLWFLEVAGTINDAGVALLFRRRLSSGQGFGE
jgi:hypothetical protein